MPMIGFTPCARHASYISTAPFITPWSVSPSAGLPSPAPPHRAPPGPGAPPRHAFDLAGAVEQRVLAVHMEVNGPGGAHVARLLAADDGPRRARSGNPAGWGARGG